MGKVYKSEDKNSYARKINFITAQYERSLNALDKANKEDRLIKMREAHGKMRLDVEALLEGREVWVLQE